jgi:hypothetical protein
MAQSPLCTPEYGLLDAPRRTAAFGMLNVGYSYVAVRIDVVDDALKAPFVGGRQLLGAPRRVSVAG